MCEQRLPDASSGPATGARSAVSSAQGDGGSAGAAPAAGSIPNLTAREPMADLQLEYRFNAALVAKIGQLERERGFTHWRRVRGDGNCYWRALLVAVLERGLSHPPGHAARLSALRRVRALAEACVGAADPVVAAAAARVRAWCDCDRGADADADGADTDASGSAPRGEGGEGARLSVEAYLEAVRCDAGGLDTDMLLVYRAAVASYLRKHADEAADGSGDTGADALSFRMAALSTGEHTDYETFLAERVEAMGEDAQGLVQVAAPAVLRARVQIIYLDRRADVGLVTCDFPAAAAAAAAATATAAAPGVGDTGGAAGAATHERGDDADAPSGAAGAGAGAGGAVGDGAGYDAYLLFKPGHYDILYHGAA